MDHLPVFLDLRGRDVLVVGGGAVAARKAEMLLRAQAHVTIIAPEAAPAVSRLAATGRLRHVARRFDETDLDGRALVVAATNQPDVNRAVHDAAMRINLPVNVVDCPALSSFIFPAIVDRSPLLVAVSSGGASPVLARLLRARLESLIPHGYGRLAALAGRFRDAVRARIADPVARRRFWEDALTGPVAEAMLAGREADAAARLGAMVARHATAGPARGEVYLVGAGPGDPDLLTFRALRLMQQADVVLHDRLVPPEIVDLARRDAERIDVGKRCGRHATSQEEIGALMVRLAREGRRVLRLKGGDPFLFGRGGEEIEMLARHDIPFQVVPGITAAAGCAAIAGIPLTHRDHASACVFVSGHGKAGNAWLDWAALAKPRQTVVVYMGLRAARAIARELIAHGAPPDGLRR